MGTDACRICGRTMDESALTDVAGRLVCPKCEPAARAGPAAAAPARSAAPGPGAGPSAPARAAAPLIALRSVAPPAPRAGMLRSLPGAMREWAAGRWWWWRLLILLAFAWMFWRHWQQLTYQSPIHGVNFLIHELGHVVFRPFGEFMGILGGSLLQCLAPVLCVALFVKQRDWFAILACFAWLSVNLFEVALYVNDARPQGMDLASPFAASGEDIIHDWNWLLTRTGLLLYDQAISRALRGLAAGAMALFLLPASWLLWVMFRSARPAGPAGAEPRAPR